MCSQTVASNYETSQDSRRNIWVHCGAAERSIVLDIIFELPPTIASCRFVDRINPERPSTRKRAAVSRPTCQLADERRCRTPGWLDYGHQRPKRVHVAGEPVKLRNEQFGADCLGM